MYKTDPGFELIIPFIYGSFYQFDSNKKTQHKLSFFDFWLILRDISRSTAQKMCWLPGSDSNRRPIGYTYPLIS